MRDEYDGLDDAALVALALSGAREAFGELLVRHGPGVERLCRRLLGAAPEAQDVAQEAALQAFLDLRRLEDPARFGAWLHAIAANMARMALRRRRALSLDVVADAAAIIWPRPAPSPEEAHAAREIHDAIVGALGELSPANREVAIGFFLAGHSYAELAELLGVPVSTVKGRLFKGRRQLRQSLAPIAQETLGHSRRTRKEPAVETNDLVEVAIDSIRRTLMSGHSVVVLREQGGTRYLPIWIGEFEAKQIALALQGEVTHRPMTHDLALRLLEPLGAEVRRVVVSKIVDNTFFAEIALAVGGQEHVVDARPSDALALAVRNGAPVLVARAVLESAGASEGSPETSAGPGDTLLVGGAPGEREPPPPLLMPTLAYLNLLLSDEAQPGVMFRLADIVWDERFPARPAEWDGQALSAVRLRDGEDPAWLLVTPALWEQVSGAAKHQIEAEREVRASLTKPPEAGT